MFNGQVKLFCVQVFIFLLLNSCLVKMLWSVPILNSFAQMIIWWPYRSPLLLKLIDLADYLCFIFILLDILEILRGGRVYKVRWTCWNVICHVTFSHLIVFLDFFHFLYVGLRCFTELLLNQPMISISGHNRPRHASLIKSLLAKNPFRRCLSCRWVKHFPMILLLSLLLSRSLHNEFVIDLPLLLLNPLALMPILNNLFPDHLSLLLLPDLLFLNLPLRILLFPHLNQLLLPPLLLFLL